MSSLPASRDERSPAVPIASFASDLSPSTSMDSGDGPTKAMSLSKQARTNAGFSLRNPYPGWTASQPVVIAAATTLGIFR